MSPNVKTNLIRCLTITEAVILQRGMASGKRVATHIIVSKNWLPAFGFGNGLTQSIITSGGPLSALTCCVNVRLLSAIKKISPLIYSQSWVGSWVYTTQAMMTFTLIF